MRRVVAHWAPDLLVLSVLAAATAGFVALLAHTSGPDVSAGSPTHSTVADVGVRPLPRTFVDRAYRPPVANKPRLTRLVVEAARGPSWVVARVGSATGRVLYAATLQQGHTMRAEAARVFLRLGAASQVDITVNGHSLARPLAGTVNVMLTPTGPAR